jgi:hypothetical protein
MKHATGGDPMTDRKWTRKTTGKIAKELKKLGIKVSAKTVGNLLKSMGYSLRVNQKKIASGSKNPPKPKERNRQFEYISELRETFAKKGNPIISVDAKKKELIGNFKNAGKAWEKEALPVNDHDFRSDARGLAVPFGLYDTQANLGYVSVGNSAETPAFAVDSIEHWWIHYGQKLYPSARELLVLADCGGANAARSRVLKYEIQRQFCDVYNLKVTFCHYPPGTSKWNPIEHRLFSQITKNWAGKPLVSFKAAANYIRGTRTESGLKVRAWLVRRKYEKGKKVSEEEMKKVVLSRHKTLPQWNYTISPRRM